MNLTPYKDDDLLLYDQTGAKSSPAATYLARQGFNSVYYMTDGLTDWMAEGYETFTTAEDGGICTSLAPLAYAGADQSVNENAAVTLRGQGSDPDGGAVTYAWTQAQGSNTVVLSSATAAQPVFTAPNLNGSDDTLIFHLTVTDNEGDKDTDSVTVQVNWNNAGPTANAGPDQTVSSGTLVTLNGSGSTDPENSIASYQWSASSGTINPTLSNASTVSPSFTASATGWVVFQLTVTDNGGLTDTDTVKVTVAAGANNPPVAEAGANQAVTEGASVTLDSSGSTDSDGTISSREWTQTSGPSVTLSNRFAAKPTFTAPSVTASTPLNFSLTVTDDDGATDIDTVTVTVNDSGGTSTDPPAAPTGVAATDGTPADKVRVTWQTSAGADSYDVYRADMPAWAGASPSRIASSVSGSSYDDATAISGSQYYYWVKARNSKGLSAFSMFDTGYRGGKGAVPKAPTGVDAEDGGTGKVTISWNTSAGALVYEVYRATIPAYLGGQLTKIATVTATTYDDGSASPGSQYYYWVKARSSWGVSFYSTFDEGYVGTASSPPAAPVGVAATDGTVAGKVSISWQASSSAVLYEVWRATKLVADGGKPVRIDHVSGLSFDDTTGAAGVTYYYWVKARDSWGASGYSVYDTGFRN